MNQESTPEQEQCGFLVRAQDGNAQDGVPACLGAQAADERDGLRGDGGVERGEIALDAGENLALDGCGVSEPCGQSDLNRRTDGEKCVGQNLKPIQCGFRSRFRSGVLNNRGWRSFSNGKPGEFHLRQAENLADAADDEDRNGCRAREERVGIGGVNGFKRVVEKDLIDDERKAVSAADFKERVRLSLAGEMAGRVVGMDEDDGAGARRDGGLQRGEIKLPAVVVDERRQDEANGLGVGQIVKERITGRGDENLVAGVAEQAKQKAVCLAGAGGQNDSSRIEGDVSPGVVSGDGFSGAQLAARIGIVVERGGRSERLEQVARVTDSTARGIGDGKIENRQAATLGERAGERSGFRVPVGATGKPHGFRIARGSRGNAGETQRMSIRAVVFDYGMVLSGPPDAASRAELLRITGMDEAAFEALYWVDRHAYDRGELSGIAFWRKFAHDAGLALDEAALNELNGWDARMWTTENPAMMRWQKRLREDGFMTAILSNMGDAVLASIEANLAWVNGFDVRIWSYQHGCAKPEAEIYRLLLRELATAPEETLFLDDKRVNVEAARRAGIRALEFASVEQLRQDLISAGLDRALPLPE